MSAKHPTARELLMDPAYYPACSGPKSIALGLLDELEAQARPAAASEGHAHALYDCGGKGHGSDASEVQWCHDCTPHRPAVASEGLREAAKEMLAHIDAYDDAMGHGYCAKQEEDGYLNSCTCGYDEMMERWRAALASAPVASELRAAALSPETKDYIAMRERGERPPSRRDLQRQLMECEDALRATEAALAAAPAVASEGHTHVLYDCGGKGHGSDVNEVQWCHDCTPHRPAAASERCVCGHLNATCTVPEGAHRG